MRALLPAMLLVAAWAQQPTARVEFEVATVKLGDPADPSSGGRMTPGRLELRNAKLKTLVMNAYDLNQFQVVGGPNWLDSAPFHIDAKYPAGTPHDQTTLMMQALLADRFKLAFHRETRNLHEYALAVAKGGPKLHRANEGDRARSSQGSRQIKAWGVPVSTFANMLIDAVGEPVVDRTGLEGNYNFILEFAPLDREDEKLPSLFTAVQQLGLRLEPTTGAVEVLVIDRAEKPSEN